MHPRLCAWFFKLFHLIFANEITSSRRWWRTGKPGVLGSQRVGHDWATQQQQNLCKTQRLALWDRLWSRPFWCQVCVKVLAAQLCLTLCDPTDYSPPGFSVHGISQARMLEWVATFFSRGSSWPRDLTWVSSIGGWFFANWTTKEVLDKLNLV